MQVLKWSLASFQFSSSWFGLAIIGIHLDWQCEAPQIIIDSIFIFIIMHNFLKLALLESGLSWWWSVSGFQWYFNIAQTPIYRIIYNPPYTTLAKKGWLKVKTLGNKYWKKTAVLEKNYPEWVVQFKLTSNMLKNTHWWCPMHTPLNTREMHREPFCTF